MKSPFPLGGADVFHLVNDRDMRARGLAGNHCAYVVELEGLLDLEALKARLDRAVRDVPELRFQLSKRTPFEPHWVSGRKGAPPIERIDAPDEAARWRALERLLAKRAGGDRPWGLDVVRTRAPEPRDTIVLRWFHPLTDSRGAEQLVRFLGADDEQAPPEASRFATSERLLEGLSRAERIAMARAYNAHIFALAKTPILSIARAEKLRQTRPDATRVHRIVLSIEETRAFDRRARKEARLAESSLMILGAARVADGALAKRGFAPPQQLIPVPLSLDAKGGSTRMLGNHITMMMFALSRDDLRDTPRAIQAIADQQRAIIRDKLDVAMAAALSLARPLPRLAYRFVSTLPFGGDTASLIFSNPGKIALERFLGLAVVDAFPMPSVVLPPGFQAIFSRFGGRLSAQIGYVEPLLSAAEVASMGEALRADLVG